MVKSNKRLIAENQGVESMLAAPVAALQQSTAAACLRAPAGDPDDAQQD
jgi:hypothetical protein